MRRCKRILAAALSAAMLATTIPAAVFAAGNSDPIPEGSLIASYPLLENVNDSSGNNKNATVHGEVSYADGLTLAGGIRTSDANADYVTLPKGMLDGQESLTITSWVKSAKNSGNYSALFAGSQAVGVDPHNYWLFNPVSKFKSVVTRADSAQPWTMEDGLTSPSTADNKDVWTHYTTVITADSLTGYINGEKIGSAPLTRNISELGSGLDVYIGRSNYLNDQTFSGSFQDLRFYSAALDDEQVQQVFSEAPASSTRAIVLQKAADALTLGNTANLVSDLSLPETGAYGALIHWSSSNPAAVADNGSVTLAAEAQTAVLTATIAIGGESVTKDFTVMVAPQGEIMNVVLSHLTLPYILAGSDTLPVSVDGAQIAWASDNQQVVANDGTITPPTEGISGEVGLTATVTLDGQTAAKSFTVRVIESDPATLAAYTRNGGNLSSSLHLGYKNGDTYTALYHNTGILFAKADYTADALRGTTTLLADPQIFRLADGSGFGVVATRKDAAAKSSVLLFTTPNLIDYTEMGLVSMNSEDKKVNKPSGSYNSSDQKYHIRWTDDSGQVFENTMGDWSNPPAASAPQPSSAAAPETVETGIENALPANTLALTKAEMKTVKDKFAPIVNTTVDQPELQTEVGQPLTAEDLGKVTAHYSDGSTAQKPVNWDAASLANVDFTKEGAYFVTGTVKQTDYPFPMINSAADPNVLQYNGKFYFIATDENGQDELYIREADTVAGLASAPSKLIFSKDNNDMRGCIWAPELHVVDGKLYIFFAASTTGSWDAVQSRVMPLKAGGSPTSKDGWEAPKPVRMQGDTDGYLYDRGITLDMTCFENNGTYYVAWSQRQRRNAQGEAEDGPADLFIAKVKTDEPWVVTTTPVRIATPDASWDRNTTLVDEGPFALKNDGKIYVTFSGSGVDRTYAVGLMSADQSAEDLTDPSVWKKEPRPILSSASVPGQDGPGHNSYTVDEDGQTVNIFHAIPTNGSGRHMGARRVHWAADGSPVLDMTIDQEILPANRAVTATITVGDPASDNPQLDAAINGILIPNADAITGNITLPQSDPATSTVFSWQSSDETVISAVAGKNNRYFDTPAGVVTRPTDKDAQVKLTVTGKLNGDTATRVIDVTVKKAPEQKDYVGYLYTYFSGEENDGGRRDNQQVYFAVSKDGRVWDDLNENNPVLTSQLGDKYVRDPCIIRSAEGDKFYLIATDLDIYADKYGGNWGNMSRKGSQSLMIWESTDLVNWSEQRMVPVAASIEAGAAWAPEITYDDATGEYLVYWSSRVAADNFAKNRTYVCKTRDFYSFTEPEVYSDDPNGNIDASVRKIGDDYYRVIKDDKTATVKLEKSDNGHPLNYEDTSNRGSHFTRIPNKNLEAMRGGYEGPTLFQYNNSNQVCVMVDEYTGQNRGYIPFVTDNLDEPDSLELLHADQCVMPSYPKHGGFVPITQEEYDALTEKWMVKPQNPNEQQSKYPLLSYDFEQADGNAVADTSGNGYHAALFGTAQITNDPDKGNVLKLDGTTGSYAELPQGFFDARNQMTISMDVKSEMDNGNFFTFTVGQNTKKYLFLRTRNQGVRNAITTQSYQKEYQVTTGADGSYKDRWINITMVMDGHTMKLYIDGELADENNYSKSVGDLGSNLLSYIGKSFYNDPYFKGSIDNFDVYNRVLSDDEIKNGVQPVLSGLTVTPPEKTSYTVGESLDTTGLIATASYDNGMDKEVTADVSVAPTALDEVGTQTITVSYQNKIASFDVTVNPADKAKLQEAVDKAPQDSDAQTYTEDSWSVYQLALKDAKKVLADKNATQKRVGDTLQALQDAVDRLIVKDASSEEPSKEPGGESSQESSSQTSGSVSPSASVKPDSSSVPAGSGSAQTGDAVPAVAASVLMLAAGAVAVWMKRRKK